MNFRGFDLGRLLLVLMVVGPGFSAFAQTAQITGRVTDASGGVVTRAEVRAHNRATGADRTTLSNELGLYTIPLLPPGAYDISVSLAGFKSATQLGVSL